MPVSQTARQGKTFTFRGFVRQLDNGKYLGVCLTLNLVVESHSLEGAKKALENLIVAYLQDAIEGGKLNERWMWRPAAVGHYVTYAAACLSILFNRFHRATGDVYTFSLNKALPQHA